MQGQIRSLAANQGVVIHLYLTFYRASPLGTGAGRQITLPGFRMFPGSNAAFKVRIKPISAGLRYSSK